MCYSIFDKAKGLNLNRPFKEITLWHKRAANRDYAFNIVPPALETLVATFAVADVPGLSESELEDIFYNNAFETYSSCCKKKGKDYV